MNLENGDDPKAPTRSLEHVTDGEYTAATESGR